MLGQFIGEGVHIGLQGLSAFPGVCELLLKLNSGSQLLLDLRKLGLQGRELATLIKTAAVQLFFQGVVSLCIRSVFLTGRDEGSHAAFQPGILCDGQPTLADKGAALKNLPADAQEGLSAVRSGQPLH